MYKTMLVPLDGSKLAEVVFTYARELAGRLDIDVVFLHVCTPEEAGILPMYRIYVERSAEMVRRESEKVRKDTGAKGRALAVKGEVATGYPAEEILRYADENKIDLILMATHGRSGVRRWVLGSVVDKVLRASRVPVWLVRAGVSEEIVYDRLPKRAILVPLDGSPLAESVLPHVEAVARLRGVELIEVVLLRVCETEAISAVSYYLTPSGYPPTTPLKWEDHVKRESEKYRLDCKRYLDTIAKQLKESGIQVRTEVLEGNPAEVIVDYASKNPFNLIVMATHGRSGVSKWAYGSVAEKVLLGVTSPLLLVRPKQSRVV